MNVKAGRESADKSAPRPSDAQIRELSARLSAASKAPLFQIGEESSCPDCGGRMITTNDLERTVPVPGIVFVVTRLPGARCLDCGAEQIDGGGVGIVETTIPRPIVADYETAVTHSSGTTLGTYFRTDLARVLALTGHERLYWKVVDKNRAIVEVFRSQLEDSKSGESWLTLSDRLQTSSQKKARRRRPATSVKSKSS